MGKRSTSRRLAMQALFQAEHSRSGIKPALRDIFESDRFLEDTKNFAEHLAVETSERKAEIDQLIKKHIKDWSIDRLSGVNRSILRMAFCELLLGESPSSVVINEALNLAQRYSDPESVKFINGILGAYLKCGIKKT